MVFRIVLGLSLLALALGNEINSTSYITGDNFASAKEFPYVVSILYRSYYICGGSIISSNTVLTAAQCVLNFLPGGRFHTPTLAGATVIAGSNYLPNGISARIVGVYPHPYFNPLDSYANDIAVIKLLQPLPITPTIRPISLPYGPEPSIYSRVDVAGFGVQEPNSINSNLLRKTAFPIMSNGRCQSLWDLRALPHQKINIRPMQMCTDSQYISNKLCIGDGGSGLISNNQVVGVVSFGDVDCINGAPVVSTRVRSYLGFINQHL